MTKRRVVIGILIALVVAALTAKVHSVQDLQAGAQFFWRADEAYLFIGVKHLGLRAAPAKLLLPLLMLAPFGLGADDSHFRMVVFRITRDRIDRYDVDNMQMGLFQVSDGSIRQGEWRWDRDHFERLTYEEAVAPSRGDLKFSGVDGWSKRPASSGTTPPEGRRIPFELSGQPATLTVHGVLMVSASIDLQRGDGPAERIWSLDQRERLVSRSEYDTLFKR